MSNHSGTGLLTNLRVKRVALVDVGANLDKTTGDGAHIMLFKRAVKKDDGPSLASVHSDSPDWDIDDQDEYEKATLTGEGRRGLPDSAFAAVWTDSKGKHRKLPIHDAGHLAAARGRIDAADIPADVKAAARRKIEAATPTHKETGTMKTLKEVLKGALAAMLEPDAAKRELAAKAAAADLEKIDEGGGVMLNAAHVDALKAYAKALDSTIKAFGDGPHPATHPVHSMKRQYDDTCTTLKAAGFDINGEMGKMTTDPEVEKRLNTLATQNSDLLKRLNEQVDKGIRVEVETVLKSFRAVPLKITGEGNDVDRYIEMYKSNRPLYDRQIELFKATDAQLAHSAAFRNVGKNGGNGEGDAWGRIEAEAEKLLAKSANKDLTREAAIDKILLDPVHATLVKQYRDEQQ